MNDTTPRPLDAVEFDHPNRRVINGSELKPGHLVDLRPLVDHPALLEGRDVRAEERYDGEALVFTVRGHDEPVTLIKANPYTILPYDRVCPNDGEVHETTQPPGNKWGDLCGWCLQDQC